MKGLHGKNVLVTGGTSGIGQAIAVKFAEYGCNVAINYRKRPEDAAETEQQVQACAKAVHGHNVEGVLVQADVSNEEQVVAMFADAIEKLGGIDILINNAGVQIANNSDEQKMADIDRVLNINLRGSFMCAQQAIKHFLAKDKAGVIINVSSVHQIIPKPRFVGYSMSKGGMQNMTRTLALEYAERKIRVNAIGPGATVTPINRAWVDDPEKSAQVLKHIPMSRRYGRRNGRSCRISGLRQRGVHHRTDPLRGRRLDPLPRLP